MPGDNVEMVCSLVFDVAMEIGTRYAVVNSSVKDVSLMLCCRFTLREANKTSEFSLFEYKQFHIYLSSTVGTGVVTKILEGAT
jgi:hypothetical protein